MAPLEELTNDQIKELILDLGDTVTKLEQLLCASNVTDVQAAAIYQVKAAHHLLISTVEWPEDEEAQDER